MRTDITIVIPTYNYAKYLKESIQSCLDQTIQTQIIIVDDGSTDDTFQVVQAFTLAIGMERVHYLHKENTKTAAAARNFGIKYAIDNLGCNLIATLDADDLLYPNFIEKGLAELDRTGAAIFFCDAKCFEESTDTIFSSPFNMSVLSGNYELYCSLFYAKVWQNVKGYDEDIPFSGLEDWTFWIKAYRKHFEGVYLNEELFKYRVHKDSMKFISLIPHTGELRKWMQDKGYI
ncbi:MAG: glycosyltransferase family 2 protein [Rhabdochlamydiaceae bacterium]